MAFPPFASGPDPDGSALQWRFAPSLDGPVMLVAFEGWNDAGEAATTAVRALGRQWDVDPFAAVDPETFYDFTSTRPRVRFDEDGRRQVVWPENLFSCGTAAEGIDVITLVGVEPQLRWRTFCEQILTVARDTAASMVVTFGALLADVAHSRPVEVYGVSDDEALCAELGLSPSSYEGPTGITGVLHTVCREAGLPSVSLWAAVPTYVPTAPSPKAALALVERATQLLDVAADTLELAEEAEEYERQVSEVVADDEDTADYVAQLERDFDDRDAMADDGDDLIEEVERFLRDQR